MKINGNQTVLITGGTRGIGRAVARALAEQGAGRIFVNYSQDDTAADETKRQVEEAGAECIVLRANLALPSAVADLFSSLKKSVPKLDGFVHCAALGAFKPLSQVRPNQWDLSLSINARSFVQCVQACTELMNGGAIVAISSLGGRFALPRYGAIGPSKAALEASVRQLAAELGPNDIRINAVAGGFIETGSMTRLPEYASIRAWVAEHTPLARIGQPEDIADVVAYLLSPRARWIQGQVIIADGGFSLGYTDFMSPQEK